MNMNMDVIYLTHNRKEFTQVTLPSLLRSVGNRANIWLFDDESCDGTKEHLKAELKALRFCSKVLLCEGEFGNPNAAVNSFLEMSEGNFVAKIDNDFDLRLNDLVEIAEIAFKDPELYLLGLRDDNHLCDQEVSPIRDRFTAENATHVGGIYVARREVFFEPIPCNGMFFGWTRYQAEIKSRFGENSIRWTPMSCGRLLDSLQENKELVAQYVANGWMRVTSATVK